MQHPTVSGMVRLRSCPGEWPRVRPGIRLPPADDWAHCNAHDVPATDDTAALLCLGEWYVTIPGLAWSAASSEQRA